MALRHVLKRTTIWSRIIVGRNFCNSNVKLTSKTKNDLESFKNKLSEGPSFSDFVQGNASSINTTASIDKEKHGKSVYFETYGCQMNVNDTEVAWSILNKNGYSKSIDIASANVVLLMTCSIREGAETKIWKRLNYLKSIKKLKRRKKENFQICILGCMAERLKKDLLDHVDVICGPDAYKDLPNLLHKSSMLGASAMNVALSLEETYADVTPLRLNESSVSAFAGCDNMCSYCIVPFTRGRERSRPMDSIINEIEQIADQGVKEVTLLGQNVNSYRDTSSGGGSYVTKTSSGFRTIYKPKKGGKRFAELISTIADRVPDMRIRFTSPHPKDFPDELIYAIKEYPNICKQIHLPAQSGSSKVLDDMRRGYTREAYLELVDHIRSIVPGIKTYIALSSDFIAGFCGETEEDHLETLSLMKLVKYNYSFCFPYSLRGKTRAYHRLNDDVPQEVKSRRHMELIDQFRKDALEINQGFINEEQLVLIECDSKRSELDWAGRNDQNVKVILPKQEVYDSEKGIQRNIEIGDFVAVKINSATSQTLKGDPIRISSIREWNNLKDAERINNYSS
ncbi:DgyrCDS9135 [Dimorphilus gyrociliatus]|uniref:DgyrCDS9135 n=1 Tax=Dimorphilus gyrociliatus TaxID=2664684 RepID=A0A7I8VXM6_9ANNE|nr:DgyrCDS9135 [Dimorphilus gyrociliatus]